MSEPTSWERLLAQSKDSRAARFVYQPDEKLLPEGADVSDAELARVTAERDELRGALREIAEDADEDGNERIARRARAALARGGEVLPRPDYVLRAEAAEAELARVREAINHACYALDPNQGERPDPVRAYQWLRTTFPASHPNYVSADALARGGAS